MAVTQEKNIDILEKLPDGNFKIKYPKTKAEQIIGQGLFGTTTGTNTYAVSMNNVPTLYAGLRVTVKFAITNTGASTLNVNSLGAKSIVKAGTALSSGNLKTNGVYTLVYDGSNFQLQGEGLTKGDVGLGSVENYGIATQAEAQAGASNVKYMTPLRVKEEINSQAIPITYLLPIAGDIYYDGVIPSGAREYYSTAYTPITSIKFDTIHPGTVRLRFGLRAMSGIAYARIYKNGVAVGTVRNATTTIVWFSEDFSVASGDLFSVYAYTTNNDKPFNVYGLRCGFATPIFMVMNRPGVASGDPSFP